MIRVCQMRGCSVLALYSAYALFYRSCPASHNIHLVKFCVKVFLYPTVGDLFIQSCSLYISIVTWLCDSVDSVDSVDRRRNNA